MADLVPVELVVEAEGADSVGVEVGLRAPGSVVVVVTVVQAAVVADARAATRVAVVEAWAAVRLAGSSELVEYAAVAAAAVAGTAAVDLEASAVAVMRTSDNGCQSGSAPRDRERRYRTRHVRCSETSSRQQRRARCGAHRLALCRTCHSRCRQSTSCDDTKAASGGCLPSAPQRGSLQAHRAQGPTGHKSYQTR